MTEQTEWWKGLEKNLKQT